MKRKRVNTQGPARRTTIVRILRTTRVPTQKDLRAELLREGFEIGQSTVSKDLQRVGARLCGDEDGVMWRIPTYEQPQHQAAS